MLKSLSLTCTLILGFLLTSCGGFTNTSVSQPQNANVFSLKQDEFVGIGTTLFHFLEQSSWKVSDVQAGVLVPHGKPNEGIPVIAAIGKEGSVVFSMTGTLLFKLNSTQFKPLENLQSKISAENKVFWLKPEFHLNKLLTYDAAVGASKAARVQLDHMHDKVSDNIKPEYDDMMDTYFRAQISFLEAYNSDDLSEKVSKIQKGNKELSKGFVRLRKLQQLVLQNPLNPKPEVYEASLLGFLKWVSEEVIFVSFAQDLAGNLGQSTATTTLSDFVSTVRSDIGVQSQKMSVFLKACVESF